MLCPGSGFGATSRTILIGSSLSSALDFLTMCIVPPVGFIVAIPAPSYPRVCIFSRPSKRNLLAPNPFLPTTAVIAVQSAFSLFQLINPAPVAAAAATMTAAAPRISASELFVDEAAVEAGAALKDRMTVG